MRAKLDEFLAAAGDAREEGALLNELGPELLELVKEASKQELDEGLIRLLDALDAPHPQVGGFVALIGGCFVENGADAATLVTALVPQVGRALTLAARVLKAASEQPEVQDDAADGASVRVADRLISAQAWQALVNADPLSPQSLCSVDDLCRALIAALTRAPEMLERSEVRALGTLLGAVGDHSQFAHFLARLLRVPMDEEWLVIDPRSNRGFSLRVSGVANAFQVYALVHAALCAVPRSLFKWSRPVASPPPPTHVLAVAQGSGPQQIDATYVPPFTLFRWSAITRLGYIPTNEDYREWYSNSAVPAELARFNGRRIAVLGNFGIKMQLGAAREFGALKARVTLERELEQRHVIELLRAFSAAPRLEHPIAGVGWP